MLFYADGRRLSESGIRNRLTGNQYRRTFELTRRLRWTALLTFRQHKDLRSVARPGPEFP
jgi:hypothetical protein